MAEPMFPSAEQEGFRKDTEVYIIRHGKPTYTKEEHDTGEFEGFLDEKARKKVEEEARDFANKTELAGKRMIIWSSPKKRAQETAEIYRKAFREKGIDVLSLTKDDAGIGHIKNQKKMKDIQVTIALIRQVRELIKSGELSGWDKLMEHWGESGENLPEGMESLEQVTERMNKVLGYIEILSRKLKFEDGKKPCFVLFGHEELFTGLLEKVFSKGKKEGEGPTYGEQVKIDLQNSSEGKTAKLRVNFRGQEGETNFSKE